MDNFPLITVGITNYNYSKFVTEALDSVACQTYPNIELVIVDDFSTDNSEEIISRWVKSNEHKLRIVFIRNENNKGLAASTNIILINARGKYLQLLDADDTLFPDKLLKQYSILENSPNSALVYSNLLVTDISGQILNPDYFNRIHFDRNNMPQGRVLNDLIRFNFIPAHSPLFYTSYAREAGGFDESLKLQDYYMWLKLSEKYEIKYLNEVLGKYRIHGTSMSNNISTYPASAESAMELRYRYYTRSDEQLKKIIAKNIHFGSVYLYEQKYVSDKKWLAIAFKLYPGPKTFLYFLSSRLGIPFSIFKSIKKLIGKN